MIPGIFRLLISGSRVSVMKHVCLVSLMKHLAKDACSMRELCVRGKSEITQSKRGRSVSKPWD
jgi:hypothetical protein